MSEHTAENNAPYMRLRGDGGSVNRYRASKDNAEVHLYLDVRGKYLVADLLAAIAEQGAQPEDVTFRGGCFVITQPATADDVQRWEEADATQEERARRSRRDWYERLRAEFDDDSTHITPPGSTADQESDA